jgi:rhamnosyltransferase
MKASCRLAVIMRSMNEQPHTRRALEGLMRQTARDFTLYNVDSGSTDGTLEVVREFNRERVRTIAPKEYVPGKVLNEMVAAAPEPVVVLLNADAVPLDERWLERLVAPILAGEADATMSRQVARADAHFVVAYDYERAYDPSNLKEENEDFFSAVACAFRRSLWEATPFYVEGYAEDLLWARECRRKGARFRLVMDSVVEHSHNYSLESLRRKKYRHGLAYARSHGQRPRAFRQAYACAREMLRDLLHALACGRPGTIPYNLRYRWVIHRAIHDGLRDAAREAAP